jgi:DNA helicase HerA-like ATPase
VVVSFGRYEADMDLILVSNILSRLIRSRWVEKTNAFRSGKRPQPPTPLMIWLEESHKLLNPEVARQTTFGILAREMRKFGVTLGVIDQRPSEIDPDVMSQIGTRISGWLGDNSDIRGTLAGISDRGLSEQLARLAPKQEAVIMGWGVPIPVTVRVRDFFQLQAEIQQTRITSTQTAEESIAELGFN